MGVNFTFFFIVCTINHSAPYLNHCQPLMIKQKTLKHCLLYKKKFLKKAPVWSDNPAHPFFVKNTAAPVTEPLCFPNPHMNHIKKHILGLKYADGRKAQPPFKNTWKHKDYKLPGRYDKFLKDLNIK